ncbi:hypothetical protein F4810DRAFT_406686 [Camillea tinctor]|nr:hypothetical protein F4810DRAFT_406686 [Camillea tinctor]
MSTHPTRPPKPLDLATALLQSTTRPGPPSPQHARDAARGASAASAWKPDMSYTTSPSGGNPNPHTPDSVPRSSNGAGAAQGPAHHRRKPSYSAEDRKHELQMSGLGIGGKGKGEGQDGGMTTGFSER